MTNEMKKNILDAESLENLHIHYNEEGFIEEILEIQCALCGGDHCVDECDNPWAR